MRMVQSSNLADLLWYRVGGVPTASVDGESAPVKGRQCGKATVKGETCVRLALVSMAQLA